MLFLFLKPFIRLLGYDNNRICVPFQVENHYFCKSSRDYDVL